MLEFDKDLSEPSGSPRCVFNSLVVTVIIHEFLYLQALFLPNDHQVCHQHTTKSIKLTDRPIHTNREQEHVTNSP